jgi:hypothetical protein
MNSITAIEIRQQEGVAENVSDGQIVTLQPLAMRIPNGYGIYSPSKISPKKQICYKEFISHYKDHSRKIRVCFDELPPSDPEILFKRSELVTVYGFGLDCWYTLESTTS